MKIVLELTQDDLPPIALEHPGPVIRLGRDPALEIPFPESFSQGISWLHAEIKLGTTAATIGDLNSSNGTYLSGIPDRIKPNQPVPIQQGSVFLLNRVACRVVLLDMNPPIVNTNLIAPAPQQSAHIARLAKPAGAILGLLLLACMIAVIWWTTRKSEDPSSFSQVMSNATAPISETVLSKPNPSSPVSTHEPKDTPKSAEIPPKKANATTTNKNLVETPSVIDLQMPNMEQRSIGKYLKRSKSVPSILLQKRGEGYPWIALRGGETESTADIITSGTTLVGLPGYTSTLILDSGLQVDLWGNLPEFSKFPPVLDCAVVFHAIDKTGDQHNESVGISLLHGRMHLANLKREPITVRIWFLSKSWSIELLNQQSEAVVELWNLLQLDAKNEELPFPTKTILGIFAKGDVRVRTERTTHQLNEKSCLIMHGEEGDIERLQSISQLPKWWTSTQTASNHELVLLNLCDWAERIEKGKEEFADTLRSNFEDSHDPLFRSLALYHFAAIDEIDKCINSLSDKDMYIRGAAADVLRFWLQKDKGNTGRFRKMLRERSYSDSNCNLILQLLTPLTATEEKNPAIHQKFLDLLSHQDKEIRQLALWHLMKIFPDYIKLSKYDPLASETERNQALVGWRSRVNSRR